jgi:hypothetical protein
MGILKSNKSQKGCIGGAFIFSGRPDPVWDVGQGIAEKLEGIWKSLEQTTDEPQLAPRLGYRGCFLRCKPDIEWFAYNGVVTMKTARRHEARLDNSRNFERLLLDSAPKGILPEGILETR